MRLIKNTGNDRVVDELRKCLTPRSTLDLASPAFSLFAFSNLYSLLENLDQVRLVLPTPGKADLQLLGSEADRPFRNRLQTSWLARQCAEWIRRKAEFRAAPSSLPQAALITGNSGLSSPSVITGNCPFTTDGLGLTPGNQFSLIQCSESADEWAILGSWFAALWNSLPSTPEAKNTILDNLQDLAEHKAPSLIYHQILFHLFQNLGDALDEERIVKSATGIRNTLVWKKLFKFQRDGVVGAIDKLEPFRRLHHRRQRRAGQNFRGAGDHQVPRAAQ